MMRPGRRAALPFVLIAALVLTACTGLPSVGDVQPGVVTDTDAEVPDFSFRPQPPPDGATAQQIVEGFLAAGSGTASGWEVARQYLSDDFRSEWQPGAEVIVASPGTLDATETGPGAVAATVTPVANVDENGTYRPAQDKSLSLSFSLAQNLDGQWRITMAPNGVMLDSDIFATVYRDYEVAYFDPTWTYLIPDIRWFPRSNATTLIAGALVDAAPPSWLTGAVATAFTDGVDLRPGVPIESGIAQVELGSGALSLDQQTQARMQTQLDASMASAGVSGVQMLVAGTPLNPGTVPLASTDVVAQPLVRTAEGFGYLSGSEISPIEGLSEAIERVDPLAVEVSDDRTYAAVLTAARSVARVRDDGEVLVSDERPDLLAPTLDPFGFVWSVSENDPQSVNAGPSSGGDAVSLAQAWPGASSITAMRIARGGTRVAAAVTVGTTTQLWVSGIVRRGDGTPVALGEPQPLATVAGEVVDLDWLDQSSVGAIVRTADGYQVRVQPIGGPGQSISAPDNLAEIAGTHQADALLVRDTDGALSVRRGSNWARVATGVELLATQQGAR